MRPLHINQVYFLILLLSLVCLCSPLTFIVLQAIAPLTILSVHNGEPSTHFPLAYEEKLLVHVSLLASMSKQHTQKLVSVEYIDWVKVLKKHCQDH